MSGSIGGAVRKGERTGIRLLLAAVVGMGVLIVVGVVVLAATVASRLSDAPGPVTAATLPEPAGTRIQSIAGAGDRVAVLLTGGGPDRLVLVDPRSGRVTGRMGLAP